MDHIQLAKAVVDEVVVSNLAQKRKTELHKLPTSEELTIRFG